MSSLPRMSKLPFELLLALRYLRPKRTFVSIITLISVIGVSLGVAVLIIVISVMSGFDQDLREKVFGFSAHLKVHSAGDQTMANYAAVASSVASNRNVTGVAPFVMGQVFIETQPQSGEAMLVAPALRGVDSEAERKVSALATNIVAGLFDLARRDGKSGLLVGTVLAANLNLRVGDRVSVYSHKQLRKLRDAQRQKREIAISPDEYEIRGIFEAGLQEFNAMVVITSIETAQELQGLDEADTVHGLTVAIRDPLQATQVAHELEFALGSNYAVTTWLQDSPLMMAVAVEKNMMLYILFFIVLVAAFGITCTLITFIMMKTREIGLMKAIGATNTQVMRVFLAQSLIVSLMGIFTGVGLGLLAVAYRNEFLELMRRTTGAQLFPAEIYQFSQLPALVLPGDLAIICGGSLLICLVAAALPAWHASRLHPVEALRNE